MRVIVNGKERCVEPRLSVASLLKELEINDVNVLAKRNGCYIMPDAYAETGVQEGDRIDLFPAAFGG